MGINGANPRLKIESIHNKIPDKDGLFGAPPDENQEEREQHYMEEYMQEINDHIIKNLYNEIIVNSRANESLTREEVLF